jgi:hypothetical protein
MNPIGIRFFSTLAFSVLFLTLPFNARASSDQESREVHILNVQGDVRLSRGDGKHIDMKQPWEEAESGQPVEQGFAIATQKGTAEIEFEDGSTIFLAENSLILFRELSSSNDRIATQVSLATGTAAFWLQLTPNETFSIETPTDGIHFMDPHNCFFRVDAYLDSTGLTPLGDKLGNIARKGVPNLGIPKGETVFFREGAIVGVLHPPANHSIPPSEDLHPTNSAVELPEIRQFDAITEGLYDFGSPQPSWLPANLSASESFEAGSKPASQTLNAQFHTEAQPLAGDDWNQLVEAREQEKKDTLAAALKASGLPSPIAGLAGLYQHGSFFACEPYGTCWEPQQEPAARGPEAKPIPREAQTPMPNSANANFQPQVVQWQVADTTGDSCDSSTSYRTISRTAHTPQELQELLRFKSRARSNVSFQTSLWRSCYQRSWIHHRGHYAMVLPHPPSKCLGNNCKPGHPVHPPHPVLVRVGNRIGFVPAHPDDVKGKPPINLKNGILLAPEKPGEPSQRIAWNASQELTFVEQTSRALNERLAPRPIVAAAPEIHAHLTQEVPRLISSAAARPTNIVFDYKTQKFTAPAAGASGTKGKEVPVGGIASNGKIATFANNGHYAESFAHTTTAATYSGGGNPGSHSFGGHSSGGVSGGSYSHSSGSSGGGGASASGSHGSSSSGSSAASASSASSGASGGGGRAH